MNPNVITIWMLYMVHISFSGNSSLLFFLVLLFSYNLVEYLVAKEFVTSFSPPWSISRTHTCDATSYTDYSGATLIGMFGLSNMEKKTFLNLPSHWSLSVRLDLLIFGSFESPDLCAMFIDGAVYGTYKKPYKYNVCTADVTIPDTIVLYNKNITHIANSVIVELFALTDEAITNEGCAFKNFFLYVDTCH